VIARRAAGRQPAAVSAPAWSPCQAAAFGLDRLIADGQVAAVAGPEQVLAARHSVGRLKLTCHGDCQCAGYTTNADSGLRPKAEADVDVHGVNP
jgi:hypothetical protein